jgi:hypothetical protein
MEKLNPFVRIILISLAVLFLVQGIFIKPHFIYFIISIAFFLFDFIYYSGRKQRIRYWFQGYKKYLINYEGEEKKAIDSLLGDFLHSKYGGDINSNNYLRIEDLIEAIIIREYKFKTYLQANGITKYNKLILKLHDEIKLIKNEVLGA